MRKQLHQSDFFFFFIQNQLGLIWQFLCFFVIFFLLFETLPHTNTQRGKGLSYRDTIVCAVSKGDLLKELWCAVISPTSVRTAHADACDRGRGGWDRGRAVLTTCSGFMVF